MLVIPFNYEPVETTEETGTYNLGAGQYALITPRPSKTDIIADGEIIAERTIFEGQVTNGASGQWHELFKNDTGKTLTGHWKALRITSGTARTGVRTANNTGGDLSSRDMWGNTLAADFFDANSGVYVTDTTNFVTDYRVLKHGDAIVGHNTSAPSFSMQMYYYLTVENPTFQPKWVSGGNSGITITGDKFDVTLYNSIQ